MVLLMVFSFTLVWSPYAISCLLRMVGIDPGAASSLISLLFCKTSVLLNPIIYVALNPQVSWPHLVTKRQ